MLIARKQAGEDTQVSENQAQVTDIRAIRQERNPDDSF